MYLLIRGNFQRKDEIFFYLYHPSSPLPAPHKELPSLDNHFKVMFLKSEGLVVQCALTN